MGLLDSVTPQQRQIAMIGVPAVAAFALISKFRKPAADASNSEDAPGTTSGWTMPSTDAIGTGQLADFESLVTARLNDLSVKTEETGLYTGSLTEQLATKLGSLTQQVSGLASAPPPPPPVQHETYPAPPPPPPPPCSPPAGFPGLGGETIIKRLDAPGSGCWYITNLGGVATAGGAPFKGSCVGPCETGPGYPMWNPPRYMVDAANLGSGYQMWSNRGEHYAFP